MARKEKPTFITEKEPFPQRLKTFLEESGTTQTELANYIGCTRQAISLYVTGQSTPDIKVLLKIAEFFNVSTDYLLGITDIKSININIKEISQRTGLTEEAIKVLENYNAENKKFIFALNSMLHQEYSSDEQTYPVLSRISDFLNTYIKGGQIYKFEDGQLKKDSQCQRQKFEFNNKNVVRPFSLRLIVHEFMLSEIEQALRKLKLHIFPESGEIDGKHNKEE